MIDLTAAERVELYGSADLDPKHGWKPDLTKFVAVPSVEHDDDGMWCLAPKVFWERNGCIPDWHSGFDIPGFGEAMEHTFEFEGDGDPVAALAAAGIAVDMEPAWYFDR